MIGRERTGILWPNHTRAFRPTDHTLTTHSIQSRTQSGYAAQMMGAPKFANELYFKWGHPENKNMSRWFGHALAATAVAQARAFSRATQQETVAA